MDILRDLSSGSNNESLEISPPDPETFDRIRHTSKDQRQIHHFSKDVEQKAHKAESQNPHSEAQNPMRDVHKFYFGPEEYEDDNFEGKLFSKHVL